MHLSTDAGLSLVSCVLMASQAKNGVTVRSSGWSAGYLETAQQSCCLETLAAGSQGGVSTIQLKSRNAGCQRPEKTWP